MHTLLGKRIVCAVLLIALLASLAGCGRRYKEKDFIGLSSKEIEEKYGEFECVGSDPDEDGVYRNGCGGYVVQENPLRWFMIYFDENGIAYRGGYEQVGGN